MGKEGALRAKAKAMVKKKGGVVLPLRGWLKGTPDALVIHEGRLILVEFKAPDGKLSPSQVALHRQIRQAGVTVAVVRDIEAAEKLLGPIGGTQNKN